MALGTTLHGWMWVAGVRKFLVANRRRGGVVEVCLVGRCGGGTGRGVGVADSAIAVVLAVVESGPHAAVGALAG